MTSPPVLHVLEALEGGTARHLVDLVAQVDTVEHHVAIPERRSSGFTDLAAAGRIAEAGGTIHHVPMTRSPVTVVNAKAVRVVRRLIHRVRPVVVHAHSSIGGAVGRVAAKGLAPAIYTPHGLHPSRAAMYAERQLGCRFSDRVVAVSRSEAAEIAARRLARPDQLVTIPNGVAPISPVGAPSLRDALGLPGDAFIVGTVGRMVAQKAPEVFVAAMQLVVSRHPGVHAVYIGTGPEQGRFTAAVAAAGQPGRFHHIDQLDRAEQAIAQFDLFVLTSRYEGGAYAPLEAMRAGVPVVLTDTTGNRDCVHDQVSGRLVPPDDPLAIAEAIDSLIVDRAHAASLAAAAARRVEDLFSLGAMTESYRQLYDEVSRLRHL